MTANCQRLDIFSTYVVLGDEGKATPIPVSDRCSEDLDQQFVSFQDQRLVSGFTFNQDPGCFYVTLVKF
jgi:hypothetical protein